MCQPRCSFWPSAPTLPPLTPFHRTGQQQSYRVASTPLAERVLATEACCNLALSLPASPAYTLPNILNLALSKPTWVSRSLSSGLALPSWGLDGSSPLESQENGLYPTQYRGRNRLRGRMGSGREKDLLGNEGLIFLGY